jgi:hypothetical protein
MKISNLEKISNELDEAREKRAKLNLPQIDFEQYMAARTEDIASIKTASDFANQVNEFFNGDSTSNGISLPWS